MRVSTIHLRALVEAFEMHGRRGAELIAAAGLAPELLATSYAWLDLEPFDRALCVAVELSADPAFGLHWGERAAMQHFDVLPPLVVSASNLRSGLECLLGFQDMLGDRREVRLEEAADGARLHFIPLPMTPLAARVRCDLLVSGFDRLLRHAGAVDGQIQRVTLEHAQTEYDAEYRRIFSGARLRFDAGSSGILFDRRLLDRPLLLQNPVLHQALEGQARRVRALVLGATSLHERVEQQLRAAPPERCDMPHVARALGVSERSLRRRLESEGHTFKELAEATRRERARELLRDLARPLKDIAAQLGFADVRAFHRAFRRWTGATPREHRRQLTLAGVGEVNAAFAVARADAGTRRVRSAG